MTTPEYLTITAFARICGVSAKTLRFYGDIGLFRPAFVEPRTRYRFYSPEQLRDFAQIQSLRECGASLAEIRSALRGTRSASEQRKFLQRLRHAKLAEVDEVRRSLAWIEGALQQLELKSPIHATIAYCPAVKVASIRVDVKDYAAIQQHEEALWKAVAPRTHGRLRGVLWHRCADAGLLEGEPFVEVQKAATVCAAAYEVKELPGAHIARAFTSTDDEEAENTYVGLSRWIRANGYRLAGARREIYRGQLLEIQYPVQAG
jgi:DNA-binding transcriptional MerR regulator